MISFNHYSLNIAYTTPLRDISFNISSGESVAVIGAVGSGKSMLLSVIAQLIWEYEYFSQITAFQQVGSLRILGHSVSLNKKPSSYILRNIRRDIALVSEKSAWLPVSVAENFILAQNLLGVFPIYSFRQIIENLPLSSQNKARILSLSELLPSEVEAPFLQQLAVIRAILRKPKILLLDDPFIRMDPVLLKQTENLILNKCENTCLIWATNDLYQASRVTDLTLFMRHGTLVEFSPTSVFFTNPSTKIAENFIAGRDED